MNDLVYSDTLPGGKHWSLLAGRNSRLRLTDLEGGANVGMLFYNPLNLLERYNAPDTLKCQHTFKLTAGHCLYSDMGRIFCTIIEDTIGWHDTVCGNTNKAMVAVRWGQSNYQTERNDWLQNGFDSFVIEAAKYGMNRRDLAANVNWFSKVTVNQLGQTQLHPEASVAGAHVELQFEIDTLVLLHTCPHPLNQAAAYPKKPVRYELREGELSSPLSSSRLLVPENQRGHENNRLFHCGCG